MEEMTERRLLSSKANCSATKQLPGSARKLLKRRVTRRCLPDLSNMHRIGDIIDHRYQLTRPLGVRHGAEMWEAEHRLAGRKVTLKVIPGDADPQARDLLVSEARAAAEIGHPSVVEIYDVGVTDEGLAYLVTEPSKGETLADIVTRQGAMQAEDACQVTLQVLSGPRGGAHAANVVHGDLGRTTSCCARGRAGQLMVKISGFRSASAAPSSPTRQHGAGPQRQRRPTSTRSARYFTRC